MKAIDSKQILARAGDRKTEEMLGKIFEWRDQVSKRNEFSKDKTPFTLNLNGLIFNFNTSSAFSAVDTFDEIFINNGHCKIQEFLPEKAAVIVDAGANQGFYSMKMTQGNTSCRIYAFEPNPIEFEALTLNLASNKLSSRVKAENLALAAKAGHIEMDIVPEVGTIGSVSLKSTPRKWLKDEFTRKISAKAISLDDALRRNGLTHVDILKVDIEGSELDVLGNFDSFEAIDRIVVEYHSPGGRDELIRLITSKGFSMAFEDAEPGDYYGDLYFLRK